MGLYKLLINGGNYDCQIHEKHVTLQNGPSGTDELDILIEDIIGVHECESDNDNTDCKVSIHYIQREKNYVWIPEEIVVSGESETLQKLIADLNEQINKVTQRPRKLLVIINPVSGRSQSQNVYDEKVAPLFQMARIETTIKVSQRHEHVLQIIEEFDCNTVDGIVLCGGDGTYNQGMNALLRKTQQEAKIDLNDLKVRFLPTNIPIGCIPSGTGSVIARILYGCTDVQTATLHIIKGSRKKLPLMALYSMDKFVSCAALVFAFGKNADILHYIESYHRWMGMLKYLIVPFYYLATCSGFPAYDVEISYTERVLKEDNEVAETSTKDGKLSLRKMISVTMMFENIASSNCNITSRELWHPDYAEFRTLSECSRWTLIKRQFASVFKLASFKAPQDYVETFPATGFKLKMLSNENEKKSYKVVLDSEFIDLTEPEMEVRLLDPVVTMFSNLECSP